MDNNFHYDLPPDDDTEEMEPRVYKPIPPQSHLEFPDWDLLPEIRRQIRLQKKLKSDDHD